MEYELPALRRRSFIEKTDTEFSIEKNQRSKSLPLALKPYDGLYRQDSRGEKLISTFDQLAKTQQPNP